MLYIYIYIFCEESEINELVWRKSVKMIYIHIKLFLSACSILTNSLKCKEWQKAFADGLEQKVQMMSQQKGLTCFAFKWIWSSLKGIRLFWGLGICVQKEFILFNLFGPFLFILFLFIYLFFLHAKHQHYRFSSVTPAILYT